MTDQLAAQWHEIDHAFRGLVDPAHERGFGDPYRRAALHDARAALWLRLADHADATTSPDSPDGPDLSLYAIACHYAAQLDQADAARIRYRHRIPTPQPRTQLAKLDLQACEFCGRPWQTSLEGRCAECPRLLWGPTPTSLHDATDPTTLTEIDPVTFQPRSVEATPGDQLEALTEHLTAHHWLDHLPAMAEAAADAHREHDQATLDRLHNRLHHGVEPAPTHAQDDHASVHERAQELAHIRDRGPDPFRMPPTPPEPAEARHDDAVQAADLKAYPDRPPEEEEQP